MILAEYPYKSVRTDEHINQAVEDWINNDPEALYNHVAIKRKAFIAGAIFDKLKKKLNIL